MRSASSAEQGRLRQLRQRGRSGSDEEDQHDQDQDQDRDQDRERKAAAGGNGCGDASASPRKIDLHTLALRAAQRWRGGRLPQWAKGVPAPDLERARATVATTALVEKHPACLVGRRVRVWWCRHNCFYSGVVDGFDESTAQHYVAYDDGDKRSYNIKTKRGFELEDAAAVAGDYFDRDVAGRALYDAAHTGYESKATVLIAAGANVNWKKMDVSAAGCC